jgi:hypothetical protein
MLGNSVTNKLEDVGQVTLLGIHDNGIRSKFIRIQLTKTFLIPQPKVRQNNRRNSLLRDLS